jgi:hypothetical protein
MIKDHCSLLTFDNRGHAVLRVRFFAEGSSTSDLWIKEGLLLGVLVYMWKMQKGMMIQHKGVPFCPRQSVLRVQGGYKVCGRWQWLVSSVCATCVLVRAGLITELLTSLKVHPLKPMNSKKCTSLAQVVATAAGRGILGSEEQEQGMWSTVLSSDLRYSKIWRDM